ncbi:MAG: hypothetical protein K2N94_11425 [Lachnospiraceae bacterium]|nr:hypothetical protein [Lachnospiraceae bacterium]
MAFECWAKIARVSLRHNFLPHLLAALAVVLFAPVVFEISSLDGRLAAQPLEMLLSLTGAILLTPVFLPEQDENIRDLIRSKRTDYLAVCVLRTACSTAALAVILGGFTVLMRVCESAVTREHFFGAFASALFLGALGFFGAGVSGNTTVGYMTAMIYYILNFTLKDKLGGLYLFSMSTGDGGGKLFLLAAAVLVIAATFGWKKLRED